MQNDLSNELLETLKKLMDGGFAPVVAGSPVKATAPFVIDGLGSFRVREYEGYTGRAVDTGKPVEVPRGFVIEFKVDPKLSEALKTRAKLEVAAASSGGGKLKTKLFGVRDEILSGATRVELSGVGVFKVVSQEKPSGLKYFVNLEIDVVVKESLQKL